MNSTRSLKAPWFLDQVFWSSRSFKSRKLWGSSSSTSNRWSIKLRTEEFGGQVDILKYLSCSFSAIQKLCSPIWSKLHWVLTPFYHRINFYSNLVCSISSVGPDGLTATHTSKSSCPSLDHFWLVPTTAYRETPRRPAAMEMLWPRRPAISVLVKFARILLLHLFFFQQQTVHLQPVISHSVFPKPRQSVFITSPV